MSKPHEQHDLSRDQLRASDEVKLKLTLPAGDVVNLDVFRARFGLSRAHALLRLIRAGLALQDPRAVAILEDEEGA